MGARIEYYSERFDKSYYLHWGADNETWIKLRDEGVAEIVDQDTFEELLRSEMSDVHDYTSYEAKLQDTARLLFSYMDTFGDGFVTWDDLVDYNKTLEQDVLNNLILCSMVMVSEKGKVFHLGPPYPGSHGSTMGNVVGYIGEIKDIELLGEYVVTIKGKEIERQVDRNWEWRNENTQ